MNKHLFLLLFHFIFFFSTSAQKIGDRLDNGRLTDSTSTIFIEVTRHSEGLSGKFGGGSISNFLVYNFLTEQQTLLFPNNMYAIKGYYQEEHHYRNTMVFWQKSKQWIFIMAENVRSNLSNDCRPAILFVCDIQGNKLKQLTDETENVVEITIFEAQGFALVKIQTDSNNNNCFNNKDITYYYKRLNLSDLSFGKNIVKP